MTLDRADLAEEQIQEYAKKIDFYTSEYTLEILAKKVIENEYEIPEYQRAFTWDIQRKSRFIESLLIGLPIPFVFFWMQPQTGLLEIVDGSQRLRTLAEYFSNELELSGLERLGHLNGLRFCDLTKARQRKVLNRSIRGIILSEDTDIEARIDLFERINTGSKIANSAEIRRGVLRGPFMDLIIELSKNDTLAMLAPVTPKQKDEREHEELIARFFAYSDGLDKYRDNVTPFVFNYIKNQNVRFLENPRLCRKYRDRFISMLEFVKRHFPNGFKKTQTAKTTPRARFEAIAIGVSSALAEDKNLTVSNEQVVMMLNSQGFIKEVKSDGANAIRRLRGRIGFVKNALLGRGN